MALSAEKKKLAAVAALVGLLAFSVYYNFIAEDGAPTPPPRAQSVRATPTPKAGGAAGGQSSGEAAVTQVVWQPLPVGAMDNRVLPNIGRNIFIYPPPPPPPVIPTPTPTPPPPPPPITLVGLDPVTVEARTPGDFNLTVAGAKIPPDARAYVNGREFQPTAASDSQLRLSIPAAMKAAPGTLRIEVKSVSDPAKFYSNPLNLNVVNPPSPDYRYLGLIVKNGVSTAILKQGTDEEVISARKSEKLGNRWEIMNITPQEIEFLDTRNQVRHRLPFTGDNN